LVTTVLLTPSEAASAREDGSRSPARSRLSATAARNWLVIWTASGTLPLRSRTSGGSTIIRCSVFSRSVLSSVQCFLPFSAFSRSVLSPVQGFPRSKWSPDITA
jgi:hypothetical protein